MDPSGDYTKAGEAGVVPQQPAYAQPPPAYGAVPSIPGMDAAEQLLDKMRECYPQQNLSPNPLAVMSPEERQMTINIMRDTLNRLTVIVPLSVVQEGDSGTVARLVSAEISAVMAAAPSVNPQLVEAVIASQATPKFVLLVANTAADAFNMYSTMAMVPQGGFVSQPMTAGVSYPYNGVINQQPGVIYVQSHDHHDHDHLSNGKKNAAYVLAFIAFCFCWPMSIAACMMLNGSHSSRKATHSMIVSAIAIAIGAALVTIVFTSGIVTIYYY